MFALTLLIVSRTYEPKVFSALRCCRSRSGHMFGMGVRLGCVKPSNSAFPSLVSSTPTTQRNLAPSNVMGRPGGNDFGIRLWPGHESSAAGQLGRVDLRGRGER